MTPLLTLNSVSVIHNETGKSILDNIAFSLHQGRTLAIVGESGSGKSMISRVIMGLVPDALSCSGNILFEDNPIEQQNTLERRTLLGTSIGVIVQNGMSAFDPLIKIGKQFIETLQYHFPLNKSQAEKKAQEALTHVFPSDIQRIMQAYPHQLSGGQLQRIMIAVAFALSPKLLIADEPTTALDAPLRQEILQLLQKVIMTKKTTLIFISHDLGLVNEIADDILVMKAGKVIEYGAKQQILTAPTQEYTRYLIAARKRLSARFKQVTTQH